jgi:hypothetical protein
VAEHTAWASGLQGVSGVGDSTVPLCACGTERERAYILFLRSATTVGYAAVFEFVQMKIVTTWSGEGEFTAKHVQALARQCEKYAPLHDFVCITNGKVPGVECWPNRNKWPGWWVKFEAFAPEVKGDILYMDLDTVVIGSLEDILKVRKLTLLRDFYRDGKRLKEGLQASLMLLTEKDRPEPWEYFSNNPRSYMETYKTKGDQPLLERYYMNHAQRWQDILPGQVVSWKVNCGGGNAFSKPSIPTDARIIIFHGQPRCWDVEQFKDLY